MGALIVAVLVALIGIIPFAVGLLSFPRRQLALLEQEARLLKDLPAGEAADQMRAVIDEHVEEYVRHQRGEPRRVSVEQALLVLSGCALGGIVLSQAAGLLVARPWTAVRLPAEILGAGLVLVSVAGMAILFMRGVRVAGLLALAAWRRRREPAPGTDADNAAD